jgi:hypothetical protein
MTCMAAWPVLGRCLLSCALASALLCAASARGRAQAEPAPTRDALPTPRAEPSHRVDEESADARVRRARERLAREPQAEDVVAAALAEFDAGAGNPQAVARRARRAGWVPRITAGMRRGQGLDYATYQGDTGRLEQSTDDDLTLYAALTFELDRVVFRSEEVGLLRERRAAQDARAERAETVLTLYYERQRALLELTLQGPSPERELAVAYSTARLDAFTNGAFTRMIRASRP